jgi:iron complex transport system permease protein
MFGLALAALAIAFVFAGAGGDFGYVIPKRLIRLAAGGVGGVMFLVLILRGLR